MDLTQLANLGEFIGGVAVLVTLTQAERRVQSRRDKETEDDQGESVEHGMRDCT